MFDLRTLPATWAFAVSVSSPSDLNIEYASKIDSVQLLNILKQSDGSIHRPCLLESFTNVS